MKINFAQVPHLDIDTFGDDNLLGPDEAGNFYYNSVEFGTNPGGFEEVVIADTCRRSIPIAVESIPELMVALADIYNTHLMLEQRNQLKDLVESDFNGYAVDKEVFYEHNESVSNSVNWPFSN